MRANYRVDGKQNIIRNGRKTLFHLYRKQGDAFVHRGVFTAIGHDATDERCLSEALDHLDRQEQQAWM